MIETKCKAVLFDLDGTLVNTLTDLGNANQNTEVANGNLSHHLYHANIASLVNQTLPQQLSRKNDYANYHNKTRQSLLFRAFSAMYKPDDCTNGIDTMNLNG